jgi:hypothetical protein
MKTSNPAVGAIGVHIDMAGEPVEPPEERDRVTGLKKTGMPLPGDAGETVSECPEEERLQRSTTDA